MHTWGKGSPVNALAVRFSVCLSVCPLLSCVVSPAARSQHTRHEAAFHLLAMSLRRCALGLHRRCHAVRPQHAMTRRLTTAAPSRRLRAVFLNAERLDYDGDHHHRITGLHPHRITGLHQQQQLSLSAPTHRLPRGH